MTYHLQVRRGTDEVLAVVQYGGDAPLEEALAAAGVELVPFPSMLDPATTAQGLARDPGSPECRAALARFRAGHAGSAILLPPAPPRSGGNLKARLRALEARVATLEAGRPARP